MKVYDHYVIYGPYKRKDGRKHIIAVNSLGEKKTVSYPKYLMEVHLNRYLKSNETVDHIDRDFTNNELYNLQVILRTKHAKLDAVRLKPKAFFCPTCDKLFVADGIKLHRIKVNITIHKKFGPFCSKSCAGKYSQAVQYGLIKKQMPIKLDLEYYQLNKLEQ